LIFSYDSAVANADFFKKFMIGVIGSYSYKFRIYSGDTLVGTANIMARYSLPLEAEYALQGGV
jgi:hypothetical protein